MSIKSFLAKHYANFLVKDLYKFANRAKDCQHIIVKELLGFAKNTYFGKAHHFSEIRNYSQFKDAIPIRDYEQAKVYYDLVVEGRPNILWPGKPIYFAKTSGTTSGSKYIPITQESISNHINGAKMALLCSIVHRKTTNFVDGKMIFLSGSPALETTNRILTGRLSGIVNHHVPGYLQKNQVPSWETNIIEDWEEKLSKIVAETKELDMSLISGIPPWVLMYFEELLAATGKETVKEVFPNFDVFVYGGVNYEPYRSKIDKIIGGDVAMIETYPASEGFIAFQDQPESEGLLLNVNAGIFYEFVPAEEIFSKQPTRLQVHEVELGKNYAVIINSNAGLWGYNIGDTVKFVSKNPYRIVVTGRIKHFISAFGEHVIAEEVETALTAAVKQHGGEVVEFHVAPRVEVSEGLPYHEWFIAFERSPASIDGFEEALDASLRETNSYYNDLRAGGMLRQAVVRQLSKDSFRNYMKEQGKLGGQHKLPRLSNNRTIANQLEQYIEL